MAELEIDLKLLLSLGGAKGLDAVRARLGDIRLARARRAAAWLAENQASLRTLGLLAFGEKVGELHLAPELEDALAAAVDGLIPPPPSPTRP